MEIFDRVQDDVAIVQLTGDLALAKVDLLKRTLEGYIQDTSLKGVLINLGEVTFIDSRGLGLFMWIFNQVRQNGAKFALCSVNPRIQPLLKMTQMSSVLHIYDYEDQALQEMQRVED